MDSMAAEEFERLMEDAAELQRRAETALRLANQRLKAGAAQRRRRIVLRLYLATLAAVEGLLTTLGAVLQWATWGHIAGDAPVHAMHRALGAVYTLAAFLSAVVCVCMAAWRGVLAS